MMDWAYIVVGLVVLTGGAELLIRGATALARRFGLSELLIGLTLVGFGTSTPELVSSIQAAMMGSPGVAVGNVVGSNIANILLILGLSALIAPIVVESKAFKRDAPTLAIATLMMIGVSMTGGFGRISGLLFLVALGLYIALAYLTERAKPGEAEAERHEAEAAELPTGPRSPLLDAVLVAIGLGLLMFGAKLLVGGAINIASTLGVSETVIGLTIVAVGTSLPELVTSMMAALRGKSALALGNVVGSNLYNILGIIGVTAAMHPLEAPQEIVVFDNWVMLGATAALIVFAFSRNRIGRIEGFALTAGYALYLIWLVVKA
ncbi:MAG: calcium/sodium antiporter [Pseudomonadota bacterium]|nr:calcium/sodium antiporter [Pseudomonadota bacterium]